MERTLTQLSIYTGSVVLTEFDGLRMWAILGKTFDTYNVDAKT